MPMPPCACAKLRPTVTKTILRLERLEPRHMTAFETLHSGKEFGGCYCAVWSNFDKDWETRCQSRPHENLEHTRKKVKAGEHAGFLVIDDADGAVVGWTASGPKTSFPLLKDKPGSRRGPWDDAVWAIGCLAIGFRYRGAGNAGRIIDLVVAQARTAGANSVEAYPLDPETDNAAYRGSRKTYEGLGFVAADSEPSGESTALRMVKEL
jgi:GNAT superfamily N-acetyltransferase